MKNASIYTEHLEDIKSQLDILEYSLSDINREIARLEKMCFSRPTELSAMQYSPTPKGKYVPYEGEDLLFRMAKLKQKKNILYEVLDQKREAAENIEKALNKLDGIDYKVCYLRDVKGKNLLQIAHELEYSYDYIKEISARNRKITHY